MGVVGVVTMPGVRLLVDVVAFAAFEATSTAAVHHTSSALCAASLCDESARLVFPGSITFAEAWPSCHGQPAEISQISS